MLIGSCGMSRESRKNYLFLGFAIPDEEMEKVFSIDNFPQVQTHKFNWNLIKGLEHFDEFDFTYISARPVTDYPVFPKKKINKNKSDVRPFSARTKQSIASVRLLLPTSLRPSNAQAIESLAPP